MSKKRHVAQDNFSVSEDDDCEICHAMNMAKERGKELSFGELQTAFREANKKSSNGVFIFETKLLGHKNEVSRTIAVSDSWSLYQLAEAILAAYKFNFDHPFGFFDAGPENLYAAHVRKYELFADLIEEGQNIEPTGAGSVKRTRLNQVWSKRGDSMLFLFDYGDEWRFSVTLAATGNGPVSSTLPLLLTSVGRAPKQYR